MPPKKHPKKKAAPVTHTITISYTAGANPPFSYSIKPPQTKPRKAKLRRGDTLEWKCKDGDWTVYFKGLTPLVNSAGIGIASVSGLSGPTPAGGFISKLTDPTDVFNYGVSLVVTPGTQPEVDDPEIIIET